MTVRSVNFCLPMSGGLTCTSKTNYAVYVRDRFEDPLDAEIFRARFEAKAEPFKLAG